MFIGFKNGNGESVIHYSVNHHYSATFFSVTEVLHDLLS